MSTAVEQQLHAFVTSLLERRGAVVDWPPSEQEGNALLPQELAAAIGKDNEIVSLGYEPGANGLSVNLATNFLEWAAKLLEAEPQIGVFRVRELYLKRKELEEGIRRTFTWLNAKVKVQEARELSVEYHTWWFHGAINSEDCWETRLAVSLNSLSGVALEIPDPLGLWELEPQPGKTVVGPSTYPRAAALAKTRLIAQAAAFLDRMDSRLQRDRKRLRGYYQALLREVDTKKTRGHAQPDPEKAETKRRAVQLELQRKLAELDERYAMVATLAPVVLIRTKVPALAVDLSVFRKQALRKHTVYWNPLIKQFEPIGCSRCGEGTFAVAFTNEAVEPLCAKCGSPHPEPGKPSEGAKHAALDATSR